MREARIALFLVLFSFIALYGFSKLLGPIPFTVNSIQTTKSDFFTATGTGEVTGTAATSRLSLGVIKTAATADEAKSEANKVINKVTADLKALGIDEKKIKTSNFSVNPEIPVQPLGTSTRSSTQTEQFTANATLDVEAPSVDIANKAVDIASTDGANVIGGVSFDLSDADREKLEDQAREKAIANAKAKAKRIAQAAGLKLGRVVNINETSGPQPVFISARAADLKAEQSQPTDLQPGENKIQITVTLFYETL